MRWIFLAILLTAAPLDGQVGRTGRTNPPASPQDATAPADTIRAINPCVDAQYVALKGRPFAEMTEREYAYFLQRDQACTEYQRTIAAVEPQREATRSAGSWLIMSTLTSIVLGVIFFGF